MNVLDPGHQYLLAHLDGDRTLGVLTFVKRIIGDNYPFNEPPAYEGTTSQEVIRALIDRSKYVDMQKPHPVNKRVSALLREALFALEYRAAEIRGDSVIFQEAISDPLTGSIEQLPTCTHCGHIGCSKHGTQTLLEFDKESTIDYKRKQS